MDPVILGVLAVIGLALVAGLVEAVLRPNRRRKSIAEKFHDDAAAGSGLYGFEELDAQVRRSAEIAQNRNTRDKAKEVSR
ncbi:MAG: hypothetical protein ACPGID_06750 [Rubricella sp.]